MYCESRKQEVSLGCACILLPLSSLRRLCAVTPRRSPELHDWIGVEVSIFSVIQGHPWNDGQEGKREAKAISSALFPRLWLP